MEENNQPKIVNTNLRKPHQSLKITWSLGKSPTLSQHHLNSFLESIKLLNLVIVTDFPRLIVILYRNFTESKSLFRLIDYCQQFVLSSARPFNSTYNLLRKKQEPPWTKSCGHETKGQKSVTLIYKLLDYSVMLMNSCEFEQPAICLLYTKRNYAETSDEYLKILSLVQDKQIYNFGPKIEKPEK